MGATPFPLSLSVSSLLGERKKLRVALPTLTHTAVQSDLKVSFLPLHNPPFISFFPFIHSIMQMMMMIGTFPL